MVSLGQAIKTLLRRHGLEEAVRVHRATNLWSEVVGKSIARHCRASKMDGGTLYVHARSAAWRNEIAFQKDAILKALNSKLGAQLVKDIRFGP